MRLRTRDLVYVGILGALWGAVEASLGSVLHALNIPFTGLLLSGVGIAIALCGRILVPRAGTIVLIGLVSAFLKMLSVGGLVLNAMLAIVIESLIAEAVVDLHRPSRLSFLVAGALATTWTLAHPFVVGSLLGGQAFIAVFTTLIGSGARILGLQTSAVALVVGVLVALHLAVGVMSGVIGWDAGLMAKGRLHPPPDEDDL